MASTANFKNGLVINHKNNIYKIVEFLHVKPGKGSAFVRTKLKNVKTGQVVEETFRSGQKVEEVRLEARTYSYLYNDGNNCVFMDQSSFEQIEISNNIISNQKDLLKENIIIDIIFIKEDPIELRFPAHITLEVKETEPGERGNTAQGATKPALLETGLTINVPLFIQQNDIIKIDTKEKKYIERVKL